MKKLNQTLAWAGVLLAMSLATGKLAAQQGLDLSNLDPQQIQQQIKQRAVGFFRDKLVVTNDAEWGVIEVRLTKVVQFKMQTTLGGTGLFGGSGLLGGTRFGGRDGQGGGMDRIVRSLLGIEPIPEAEALQKAIDNHASNTELKNALAKYVEARKKKQAELVKAQTDLRQIITVQQEATLVLLGILD